ncbi:MAG: hypothetical protein ACRDZ5_02690, partial [Acidimicrobiales bacterium]
STCVAGLKESFGVEHLVLSGQATSSEHATIPKLLSDDWSACSLTDDNVYQMEANLTVPTFTGGSELVKVNRALYAWETVGAHETIGVLERLLGPPTNLSVQGQLTKAERVLTGERSRVEAARAKAAQAIGASLPVLGLPQPSPGTG